METSFQATINIKVDETATTAPMLYQCLRTIFIYLKLVLVTNVCYTIATTVWACRRQGFGISGVELSYIV